MSKWLGTVLTRIEDNKVWRGVFDSEITEEQVIAKSGLKRVDTIKIRKIDYYQEGKEDNTYLKNILEWLALCVLFLPRCVLFLLFFPFITIKEKYYE